MQDVSIIIVNYNTTRMLQDCVDSIAAHTRGIDYQIIVVDNGSTACQLEPLRRDSRITLIESDLNLGFGRANNLGLTQATGQYVLFLNSDTVLFNNAIGLMVDYARSHTDHVAAIGCVLEDADGNSIHSYGRFPQVSDVWHKLLINPVLKALRLYRAPEPALPQVSMEVDYITGADLMVARSVLDECGAFSPEFFMYYEETEMQHRFRNAGYRNILLRGPRIVHYEGGACTGIGMSRFLRDTLRQERSQYIYFRLTQPRWKYCMFRILYPLLRQTVWLNPHASIRDKWMLVKNLF